MRMDFVVWICLCLTAASVYKALAFFIKKKLRATFTALEDIPLLGLSKNNGRKLHGTAVICGGSLAGLISARVCSDHFENVVIVEPEAWVATEDGLRDRHREVSTPESPVAKRSRVAQYTSVHVYQCFLLLALKKLFPDFDNELKRAGARILPADSAMHISGIPVLTPYHKYPEEGLPASIFFSRPGYETLLRRMVLSTCPNIKYITGSVTGVVPHQSLNAIAAVVVRTHAGDETYREIPATLTVDCTGPARGGLRWLQDASFATSYSTGSDKAALPLSDLKLTYDPKMAYTTCEFDVPPSLLDMMKCASLPRNYETDATLYIYLPNPAQESNTLLISRREGNYLQMLCGGWNFRGRITSVSDIRDYVSKLTPVRPIPGYVFALLTLLEDANVPATYVHSRVPPAVYVQYYRAAQLLSNFVAVGDSVLQLNPIRGNGCSKACIDAVTLNASLARCVVTKDTQTSEDMLPHDFSRKFFATQAKRTGKMWQGQKTGDYAWSTTVPAAGDDPKTHGAWMRWYSSKVTSLTTKDPEVASVFWHVANFLASPTDLFSPGILVKVIWMQLMAVCVSASRS